MDDLTKRLSRRDLLKVGAGLVGGWVAVKAGALPALAQGGAAPLLDGSTPDTGTPPDDGPIPDDHDNDEQWERVEAAMGHTEGRVEPDDVFKFELARTDIHATIQGVMVEPDFALDTEINFLHPGSNSTVKWEFVLLGSEVNPVL